MSYFLKKQTLKINLGWLRAAPRAAWVLALALAGGPAGCDFQLPSPPPDLFYPFTVLSTGQGPAHLLAADLNQDGEADLVSTNAKDSSLTIFFGQGDGTFQPPQNVRVAAEPTHGAAGDLNHDGIPDLVVNSRGQHRFLTLLGNEGGSFQKPVSHPTGRVPLAIILGDYNQDSHLDVAVTLTFVKLELYLGRGDGTFKKGETYLTGSRAFSGVAGDFNQDEHLDIALASSSPQASSIRVFWGYGDGTFTKPLRLAPGSHPLVLAKEDMNRDGIPDLLCATGHNDNMLLIHSNGNGTFQKPISFSGGGGPMALVTGHFNGDDLLDVAVANSRSSNFSLVIRRPNGGFRYPTRDYVVDGGTPLAIAKADFNQDGLEDLAVSSNYKNTVEIYLQRRVFR